MSVLKPNQSRIKIALALLCLGAWSGEAMGFDDWEHQYEIYSQNDPSRPKAAEHIQTEANLEEEIEPDAPLIQVIPDDNPHWYNTRK